MKCAADTWSSPDHRGVHDASPSPTSPSSVCTFTSRKGEVTCDPPRPDLIASAGLIGTRTGIVSIDVMITRPRLSPRRSPRQHLHRVLETEPEEEPVDRQHGRDEQQP